VIGMTEALYRRAWRHRSVLALMQAHKSEDPEAIIRSKARDLVRRARADGWAGPPFDPLILASLLGIRCRASTELFTAEAQLSPQPGQQLLLEFNPERPDGRRNYSICHEIVHTFFDDCYELVHQRKSQRAEYDPDEEVERLCQIGAAELLMPLEEFGRDLKTVEFSLQSMNELVSRYAASREAVVRRMVYLSEAPCAAVFFSRRWSPRESENVASTGSTGRATPPKKMRILYYACSSTFPVYLPAHKSVPDSSCVATATVIDVVKTAQESWEIGGFGEWTIEAARLPTLEHADEGMPTVIALVYANQGAARSGRVAGSG